MITENVNHVFVYTLFNIDSFLKKIPIPHSIYFKNTWVYLQHKNKQTSRNQW